MASTSADGPQLSVVVVVVGDTVTPSCGTVDLGGTLEALARQIDPPSMEIIVPYHSRVVGISDLAVRFPNVQFLPVDQVKRLDGQGSSREHHDRLRARGAAITRGQIIAFLEDHVRPDPHWSRRIVEAHRQPYAAIGGAVENGIDRPLNWAAYFCDLGRYQSPVSAGESTFASLVNLSYKRAALEATRPAWQDSFNETRMHLEFRRRGEKLALSPDIVVRQFRGNLQVGIILREFLVWGRSYARTRGRLIGSGRRATLALLAPLLPGVLLMRMTARVVRKGRSVGAYARAFPLAALLTVAWSLGELMGYLAAGPGDPSPSVETGER